MKTFVAAAVARAPLPAAGIARAAHGPAINGGAGGKAWTIRSGGTGGFSGGMGADSVCLRASRHGDAGTSATVQVTRYRTLSVSNETVTIRC